MFGLINVVTRDPSSYDGAEVSGSYGSNDTYTVRATYGREYERGVGVVASFTLADSDGDERLYFAEFDDPDTFDGVAEGLDGDEAKRAYLRLSYGDFVLTGAYSTPSLYTSGDGSAFAVVSGPHELVGYDSQTGDVAWSVAGATNAPITLPVISGNRIFVCEPVGAIQPITMLSSMDANKDGKMSLEEVKSSVAMSRLLARMDNEWGNGDGVVEAAEWNKAFGGFVGKGGLVAIDLAADGESTTASVRWTYRRSVPYVPSVLVFEDVLYLVQDGGIVSALDPDTGKALKRGRLTAGGRKFYSSPVTADGKVYLVDTSGTCTVLRGGAEWEELAVNKLGEPCYATPALGEGRIYVRTEKSLYCFGED